MEKKALRQVGLVYFPFLCLLLSLFLGTGALILVPAEAEADNYYDEGRIDAGDLSSPQYLRGGPYIGITGNIGGVDTTDAFGFFWADGKFHVGQNGLPEDYSLELYESVNGFLKKNPLVETKEHLEWESVDNSPRGNYILKIFVNATSDPEYTITLLAPDGGLQPTIWAPVLNVPEPSTMLLLGSGLIGLLVLKRKFKK